MQFTYLTQPPKRYTFEMPKVKEWVESWCIGKTLNLFAGRVKLDVDEVRIDIDPEMKPDFCMDSYEFVKTYQGEPFSTIVLDPPYNLRKSREKYGERWIGSFTKIKNELPRITAQGGRIITFGYDSVGMSASRGFIKIGLCVICHNGDHNDTIGLVEKKIK